ncbi:MAG: hypothetical protein JWR34_4323 [Mycobacterium sp.]|nr:hypothetical protein [Mycobacterium sp.]
MTKPKTAGAKLRSDLNAALARAARDQGLAALEFSEVERALIAAAVTQADWIETLKALRATELAGDAAPTTLVKLSSEIRACERQVFDLIGRVNFGEGVAKSAHHQRAAHARWNRGSATPRPSVGA